MIRPVKCDTNVRTESAANAAMRRLFTSRLRMSVVPQQRTDVVAATRLAGLTAPLRTALRRFRRRLLRPFYGIALRLAPPYEAWTPIDGVQISVQAFGEGSIHPFSSYFEGTLRTPIGTIDDVMQWLRGCRYEADVQQFGVADFWLPPIEFEKSRRGDCDEHALWAWRALSELGVEARLFSGLLVKSSSLRLHHLWVVMRLDGEDVVMEATAKGREPMLIPLTAARDIYQPFCSVDRQFRVQCFGGLLLYLQALHGIGPERYRVT